MRFIKPISPGPPQFERTDRGDIYSCSGHNILKPLQQLCNVGVDPYCKYKMLVRRCGAIGSDGLFCMEGQACN